MKFRDILYAKEDGIATITFNRPKALNGLTATMGREWMAAMEDAAADDQVKVVVLTGAGRAFCSGRDMRHGEDEPESFSPLKESNSKEQNVARVVAALDKPYIGAINGPAVGAGMDYASMCDIRIASERARFSMAYVRMGLPPAVGGCYFLPRIVGIANACDLIWTGRMIDAQEALHIGYVSRVVPHDELAAATKELAMSLARGPSVAIGLSKRLIYRCLELDPEKALEEHQKAIVAAMSTEDAKEGPRAWIEKREPVFKGR
jgi:2-(1,2-epoxy-1,2-dihydrophenyl)acetyl-CoA isomerase